MTFTSLTTSLCPRYSHAQVHEGDEEEAEAEEEEAESIVHNLISLSAPPKKNFFKVNLYPKREKKRKREGEREREREGGYE